MSRHNTKRSRRSETARMRYKDLADVTLADFANSSCSRGRLRKAATQSLVREVKQMGIEEDTRAWDEKLDDYDGDFEFVKEEGTNGKEVVLKKTVHRHKKSTSSNEAYDYQSVQYPLDFWFLLSEYVRPEDVGRFAGICKSAWYVVNTPKFWFSLYKRYYKSIPQMPERLQPECMVRHYGLKSCVVRALFYMYPPFVARISSTEFMQVKVDAVYQLKTRQCILMWNEKLKNDRWMFCFKLRHNELRYRQPTNGHKPDLLETLEDISANTEQGCKVLQVTCSEYAVVPMILGQTLQSVSMHVDGQITSYVLHLVFGSGYVCNGRLLDVGTTHILLKSVLKLRVREWWHPLYPQPVSRVYYDDEEDDCS